MRLDEQRLVQTALGVAAVSVASVVSHNRVVLNAVVEGLSVDWVFGNDWSGDRSLVRSGVLFWRERGKVV